jgi:hypothetical protein
MAESTTTRLEAHILVCLFLCRCEWAPVGCVTVYSCFKWWEEKNLFRLVVHRPDRLLTDIPIV